MMSSFTARSSATTATFTDAPGLQNAAPWVMVSIERHVHVRRPHVAGNERLPTSVMIQEDDRQDELAAHGNAQIEAEPTSSRWPGHPMDGSSPWATSPPVRSTSPTRMARADTLSGPRRLVMGPEG